jgi:hypothetical protein
VSGHTPGPWRANFEDGIIFGKNDEVVCSDGTGVFAAIPNDADARLIAAAPDLLEALKLCILQVQGGPYGDSAVAVAEAAIAKATGVKS